MLAPIPVLILFSILLSVTNLLLLVMLLRRTSLRQSGGDDRVREELRLGREESRTSATELRVEVLRQIQQVDESLRRTLAEQTQLQLSHHSSIGTQLQQLSASAREASDGQRAMLDMRIKDLQDGNERRLTEIRSELGTASKDSSQALATALEQLRSSQERQLTGMSEQVKEVARTSHEALERMRDALEARVKELLEGNGRGLAEIRSELGTASKDSSQALATALEQLRSSQERQLTGMSEQVRELARTSLEALERMRDALDARVRELVEGNGRGLTEIRTELSTASKESSQGLASSMEQLRSSQERQLTGMSEQVRELAHTNQEALDRIRAALDARVRELQASNESKLDEMRKTVDEKLHEALEKRISESFKRVSEHLESVHRGLGEMQSLAAGVGDLKRVLTNVKTRGTWAEVQLGAILEQILTASQFERNVRIKPDTEERVEFAVKLPGAKDDPDGRMWLPIDSKFPHEDYGRLQSASERGDAEGVRAATDALLSAMRTCAREIHDKYVDPPATTDFAIMFLATEGLYAEALREPGFLEELQQRYRIVLAGPTTLAAILNSLRMGFQTLAVEKRAAEVWRVLGSVKTEFGRFGGWLEKIERQLQTATHTLQETGRRTRAMERQLRTVEQMDPAESARLLKLPGLPGLEGNEAQAAGEIP